MRFWYHAICCELWIILGKLSIPVEVGTRFGWYCTRKAEEHQVAMKKLR